MFLWHLSLVFQRSPFDFHMLPLLLKVLSSHGRLPTCAEVPHLRVQLQGGLQHSEAFALKGFAVTTFCDKKYSRAIFGRGDRLPTLAYQHVLLPHLSCGVFWGCAGVYWISGGQQNVSSSCAATFGIPRW